MSPGKTAFLPWFSPQLVSSPKDESQPDQTVNQDQDLSGGQRDKRGNQRGKVREKPRFVLKVKIPKVSGKMMKLGKSPRRWTNKTQPSPSANTEREAQSSGADPSSVGGDVFCFSHRPTSKAVKEKERAKLAVLRTISRVLEENQLIRQRLDALSQAN